MRFVLLGLCLSACVDDVPVFALRDATLSPMPDTRLLLETREPDTEATDGGAPGTSAPDTEALDQAP